MRRSLTAEQKEQLIERLAELGHEQWITWSKSLVTDTSTILSDSRRERWSKLWVPYAELSEDQKQQDRDWAYSTLSLIIEMNMEILSR